MGYFVSFLFVWRLVVSFHFISIHFILSLSLELHSHTLPLNVFQQLLLKFHLCTNDSDLEARFAELASDFYKAAEDKMKVLKKALFLFHYGMRLNKGTKLRVLEVTYVELRPYWSKFGSLVDPSVSCRLDFLL